jgi:DNA-binding SARP family transcriptional activator
VEFRILGPLEVWEGERQLPLTGTKQRALLALLLVHANQVVPTDRLIDELWDADARDSGWAALRVRIHELRKVLPDDVLQTRPPGYVMRVDDDRLDLHRFERLLEDGRRSLEAGAPGDAARVLREALALWRGPPLADVAHERFALAAIPRLEELRLAAVELRIQAELELGRHGELVAELEGLAAEHPLREPLRGLLMLALYRSGRQAEALEAYRGAYDVLKEELGLEPSAPLRELERAILRHDRSLDLTAKAIDRVASATMRSVLVAPADDATSIDRLLPVAEAVARDAAHEVILARLVGAEAALAPAGARLREACAELDGRSVTARAAVFTSDRPGEDLVRLAAEQDVGLVLLDAPAALLDSGHVEGDVAVVLARAVCDVALLAGGRGNVGGPVLVPFGGADHDWAAVELGAWAARAQDVPLHLLGAAAVPEEGKRDASRLLSHVSLAVQRALGVSAAPILTPPGGEAILAASAGASLLVLGLSARWQREGLGATRLALARGASAPVLLVRKGLRPGGLVPRSQLTRFTWSVRA